MTRSIVTDAVVSPMSVATAIFAFAGAVPRFWMTNVVSQPLSFFATFGRYTVVGDAACACAAGVMSGTASDSASASEITRSDLVECPSIVPLPSAPAHGRSRARSRDERRSPTRAGPRPERRGADGSNVRRATQVLARRLASGLQWPGRDARQRAAACRRACAVVARISRRDRRLVGRRDHRQDARRDDRELEPWGRAALRLHAGRGDRSADLHHRPRGAPRRAAADPGPAPPRRTHRALPDHARDEGWRADHGLGDNLAGP